MVKLKLDQRFKVAEFERRFFGLLNWLSSLKLDEQPLILCILILTGFLDAFGLFSLSQDALVLGLGR
jgi:hypothetical protein